MHEWQLTQIRQWLRQPTLHHVWAAAGPEAVRLMPVWRGRQTVAVRDPESVVGGLREQLAADAERRMGAVVFPGSVSDAEVMAAAGDSDRLAEWLAQGVVRDLLEDLHRYESVSAIVGGYCNRFRRGQDAEQLLRRFQERVQPDRTATAVLRRLCGEPANDWPRALANEVVCAYQRYEYQAGREVTIDDAATAAVHAAAAVRRFGDALDADAEEALVAVAREYPESLPEEDRRELLRLLEGVPITRLVRPGEDYAAAYQRIRGHHDQLRAVLDRARRSQ